VPLLPPYSIAPERSVPYQVSSRTTASNLVHGVQSPPLSVKASFAFALPCGSHMERVQDNRVAVAQHCTKVQYCGSRRFAGLRPRGGTCARYVAVVRRRA
jgi:hypothetical protein